MVDRFLVWVGASAVAVGVSAAMITGAGLAAADDGSNSDGGGDTSQSTNPDGGQQDSPAGAVSAPAGGLDNDDSDISDPTDPDGEETGAGEDESGLDDLDTGKDGLDQDGLDENAIVEDTTGKDDQKAAPGGDTVASSLVSPNVDIVLTDTDSWQPVNDVDTARWVPQDDPAQHGGAEEAAESDTAGQTIVPLPGPSADDEVPRLEAVVFASAAPQLAANAAATAPPLTALLDLVGTIVFNLYAVAIRLVGGPPMLPPNSTVTVRSSSLVLECGCNEGDTITVPADWYIPAGAENDPPDRLIYLQHGFLAAGPWYSHTAAALAEQTNSIVVAPSITSNFLAADACWLGAPPMHQAIAGLFEDENMALANSAAAAGYLGPIPQRVVLIGHSLGGGAVIGAAGYMRDNDSLDRLAGVVMLDGVPLGSYARQSLEKVPDTPIYQLAAPKYFWNQFGVGSDALVGARPGEFVGVTLVGGSHVDAMRGGNPLIQFAQQLVSGFSKPQNVAASQMLMVGWINDMFDPTGQTGVYLDPGEERVLHTLSGPTTLVALPNSLTKPFLFNFLQPFVSLGDGFFTFEPACVAESIGAAASCEESIAA